MHKARGIVLICFFTNVNSTISLCWNISNTLQFFKTQFFNKHQQTNFQKQPINKQYLVIFRWLLPVFLGDKIPPQKFLRKKNLLQLWGFRAANPPGITMGRRCLARRTRAVGRAKVLLKILSSLEFYFWFCRKAWDFFEWFFECFFECLDFLQAF